MPKVKIYTDGSCRGNTKKGGWAALLISSGGQLIVADTIEEPTTNNRAELLGVINSLAQLEQPCDVVLVSDSRYVVDGVNRNLKNWERNGWKTQTGDAVKNPDLWRDVSELKAKHKVKAKWVKGHHTSEPNEVVDWFARRMSA